MLGRFQEHAPRTKGNTNVSGKAADTTQDIIYIPLYHLHLWNAAKPRIRAAIGLVELSTNARIWPGCVNADALLVRSESELAGADLTADEIVVRFGNGFRLGDCGGIDGRDDEEDDSEKLHV